MGVWDYLGRTLSVNQSRVDACTQYRNKHGYVYPFPPVYEILPPMEKEEFIDDGNWEFGERRDPKTGEFISKWMRCRPVGALKIISYPSTSD